MLARSTTLCISFALATLTTVVASMPGCAQPLVNCSSAHGAYAATFELTSGDASSACGQLVGDVIGMQTYFTEGGVNGTPMYDKAKVAIRAESMGLLIERAALADIADTTDGHTANALGDFTAGYPAEDEFCEIPEFSAAEISLPEIPEIPDDPETEEDDTVPAQPATSVRYEWRNARILVSANAQGTQFSADLTYTQDGCTAEYHVVGVYPAVGCELDEECTADDSGINPDFPTRCHAELGLCVLVGEPPAFEADVEA
ncbi:MAG: hypothetical protein R3A51_13335 [Nannocystaceae bacterium]|nr:hypothetical protein [Myxococcales bacterium]